MQDDELRSKIDRVKEIKFVSPYARYLAILPLAEKQRLADQAKLDLENSKKKLCPDKVAPEDQKFVSLRFFLVSVDWIDLLCALFKVVKHEPSAEQPAEQQPDHMPLKDFGKRRRELASADQAATPQPATKRQRFDINVRDTPMSTPAASDVVSNAQPSTPSTPITSQQQRKSKKPHKPVSNKKPIQSSDKAVAFDYSQVDFGKFQGGSKSQVNTNQSTSKFHGKVIEKTTKHILSINAFHLFFQNKSKRGHDKKFNKLLTFNKGGKKKQ